MAKDIIIKEEYEQAASAVKSILENEVELSALEDCIPLIDDVSNSNNVIRGKLSILFVDIRKSSDLTEDIKAKNMVKIYRSFIRTAIQSIRYCGGVTRQFAGDGIMGVFLDDENEKSSTKAVQAARYLLTMIDYCLNSAIKKVLPDALIGCGVGIATGTILITKVGMHGQERNESAENETSLVWTGESTNLASRLCGLAQAREIFIDEPTFQALDAKDNWASTERTKGTSIYRGYAASEYYLPLAEDVEAEAVKADFAPSSPTSFVQQLFSEGRAEVTGFIDEISKKSAELTIALENIKRREAQAVEREKKVTVRENNQTQFELKKELELEENYVYDIAQNFTEEQIRQLGKDDWNRKINHIKNLYKQTGERKWAHQAHAFAKIYIALQQYEDFYDEVCYMAKDGHCVYEDSIKTILKKTCYRSALKDALQSYIDNNGDCETSDRHKKMIKMLEGNVP